MAEDADIATNRLVWDKLNAVFVEESKLGKPAPAKAAPFLRGPIPMAWLAAAAQLPGKTLHVGALLWFMAGILKRHDSIKISKRYQEAFGVARWAYAEALGRLESAGLVTVVRSGRKAPEVTILTVER